MAWARRTRQGLKEWGGAPEGVVCKRYVQGAGGVGERKGLHWAIRRAEVGGEQNGDIREESEI